MCLASLATKNQISQTKRRYDKTDLVEEAIEMEDAKAKVVFAAMEAIWATEARIRIEIREETPTVEEMK